MESQQAKVVTPKPQQADGPRVTYSNPARPSHGSVPAPLNDLLPLRARDFAIALGLAVVFTGVFLASMQSRVYGDGTGLLKLAAADSVPLRMHVAYLPALALLKALLPGIGVFANAKLFSALCGAVGCAGIYLLGRSFGWARRGSVFAGVLAAVTPVVWFFSTTVEVHTLHFASVTWGALVVLHAPWHRRVLATGLAGLALVATYCAHETSALLGPGWIVLCAVAARRQGCPLKSRDLLCGVGPALLVMGIVASLALNSALAQQSGESTFELGMLMSYFGVESIGHFLWAGVALPLVLLLPLAAVGLVKGDLRASLVLLVVVPICFNLLWRVPERGAYFLVCLPFLALLAAQGVQALRMPWRWAAGGVLLVQLGVSVGWTRAHDFGLDPAVRVELIQQATGGTGYVLTPLPLATPLQLDFDQLEEIALGPYMLVAMRRSVPHEVFATQIVRLLEETYGHALLEDGFYVETHFELAKHRGSSDLIPPYLAALDVALRERFDLQESTRAEWKIARLLPKATPQAK